MNIKIVAKVINYENYRSIETEHGERPVCDIRATLPNETKVYEEVQVRQATDGYENEYGLFISGIGKDNPNQREGHK